MEKNNLPSILMVASECAPLAKTGGLADVVGTLPQSLCRLGFDARVIIPYHRTIKEKYGNQISHLLHFYINLGWRHQYVGINTMTLDGVTVYLVDNEFYFGSEIYADGDFGIEQYAFFSLAALEATFHIDFIPNIIHANDWHTAAIPMLLKTKYQTSALASSKSVFTIHNLAFQGKCNFSLLLDLLSIQDKYSAYRYFEHFGSANLLKSALIFADKISTVSPTYAREILTQEYGEHLDGVLRDNSYKLSGIVNGIDNAVFCPMSDPHIYENFSADDTAGKILCKEELCREYGFDPARPLIAMVTRMTSQKGFDLVLSAMDDIVARGANFILLGTGEPNYENSMRYFMGKYPQNICAILNYNEALSHKLYASADFFLMPSKFEPCGISQMLSMRYGTLPIVRETGGLCDTVAPYNKNDGSGNGFSFYQYTVEDMLGAISRALEVYPDPKAMNKLICSAMTTDFSFDNSAKDYEILYRSMMM